MPEFDKIADRYLEAWNTAEPARRRELVADLFTEDAGYTDPLASVRGRDGIDGFLTAAREQLAGMPLSLAGPVDGHHDIARFTWQATPPGGGEPVVIGFDVLVLEGERIREVHGFLDKVPG